LYKFKTHVFVYYCTLVSCVVACLVLVVDHY